MDRTAFEVDADIKTAESLPPEAYLDAAFAEQERATLWRAAWTLIPSAGLGQVAATGARAPVELLGAPYFLQRDVDGALRAFPNVCTHAWHTLVSAPSTGKALACPQHGRTFDTKGRCLGQPGMPDDMPDFPRPEDHLRAVSVETWGPLAFACLDPPETPFSKVMEAVTASLGDLPLASLRPLDSGSSVREVAGNWKQHAGNYLDQLHIPFIHGQGLARSVDVPTYQTEIHPHGVLQWAVAKNPALGFEPGLLPDRFGTEPVYALWWFIWPNLTLNFYPWGLSVNLYEPIRGQPDKTRFHWHRWSWDDAKASHQDDWHMAAVDEEDVGALAEVTRGLRSGEARRGRFVPEGEASLHWFQRRVYEAAFS